MGECRHPDVEDPALGADELLDDPFGSPHLAPGGIGVSIEGARASQDRLLGRLRVAEHDQHVGRGPSPLQQVLVVRDDDGGRHPERKARDVKKAFEHGVAVSPWLA